MAVETALRPVKPRLGVPPELQDKTLNLPFFDDGIHDGIKEIVVAVSDVGINSITTTYSDGAKFRHGGPGGTLHTISFDFPKEILDQVCETLGKNDERPIVTSLTFITNYGTYGPYGNPIGIPFTFPTPRAPIKGFFGLESDFLNFLNGHVSWRVKDSS